ncbi:ciliary microtubule inner protein 2B [Chanos chanos]|uniref:Ciliary microtubule inner protein 2B n=1 Tax=Chanos chanos TaxID=29144 RepID=A0A6J2UTY7_CHACN|nr:protein FAM166B [Chanos chanos]
MEQFPPKFSKVLVTPDPHYIPGYAGYCPQLKYHLGRTYGQLTAKLLSAPDVARSKKMVLHTGRFPSTESDTGTRDEIWRSRHGDNRQLERMIPGYTGFVPKSRNHFAKTYAETCREALSEFDRDQKRTMRQTSAELPPAVNHSLDLKPQKLYTPLTATSKRATSYKPPDTWKPLRSPYQMEDSDPHKYFISGFTGYVPKSRFLIGTSYPITTNRALIQFGREMRTYPASPRPPAEDTESLCPVPTIYPAHRGLLPSYTGHIPGYKFRYGQTFGQLTNNALGLSGEQRKIGAR